MGTSRKRRAKRANHCVIFYLSVMFCPHLPLTLTIDRAERLALAHQKETSSTPRRAKQSRSISLYAVRSLSLSYLLSPFKSFTDEKTAAPLTNTNLDPPPTVRLLTPKVTRAAAVGVTAATKSESKSKSKGCAFLEFSTRHALQVALRLHQSELDGRRINVELTAGGGGKSDARLVKVKERNKHLGAQRVRTVFFNLLSLLSLTHLRTNGCLTRIDAAA